MAKQMREFKKAPDVEPMVDGEAELSSGAGGMPSSGVAVVPKAKAGVFMTYEMLCFMESAFTKIDDSLTKAIKDLSVVSGELTKQANDFAKVRAFIGRLKERASA